MNNTSFSDLDLIEPLLRALSAKNYSQPTPIQAKAIPPMLAGRDLLGIAQTGTGKTAAFGLPMLQTLAEARSPARARCPRALVLAPTRELAQQVAAEAERLAKHLDVRIICVYGGTGLGDQKNKLLAGVDLVVGTPGRLIDFTKQTYLRLSKVRWLVLDEADRMLDMGFIPDVRRIIGQLPGKDKRLTLLFSATLSEEVLRLASQWMPDPINLEVEPEQVAVATVEQITYSVPSAAKFRLLFNMLEKRPEMERVLVFGNRRDRTQILADKLAERGVSCRLLSGLVDQKKRIRILEEFREGKFRVLIQIAHDHYAGAVIQQCWAGNTRSINPDCDRQDQQPEQPRPNQHKPSPIFPAQWDASGKTNKRLISGKSQRLPS